jgi:hypothetical protein
LGGSVTDTTARVRDTLFFQLAADGWREKVVTLSVNRHLLLLGVGGAGRPGTHPRAGAAGEPRQHRELSARGLLESLGNTGSSARDGTAGMRGEGGY